MQRHSLRGFTPCSTWKRPNNPGPAAWNLRFWKLVKTARLPIDWMRLLHRHAYPGCSCRRRDRAAALRPFSLARHPVFYAPRACRAGLDRGRNQYLSSRATHPTKPTKRSAASSTRKNWSGLPWRLRRLTHGTASQSPSKLNRATTSLICRSRFDRLSRCDSE